jgi:hypothetical protein
MLSGTSMLYFLTKWRKKNIIIRKEVQIVEAEKYNHLVRAVHPLNIGSTRKPMEKKQNNLVIRSEGQILVVEKYNYLARAVHLLHIGSTRKPM